MNQIRVLEQIGDLSEAKSVETSHQRRIPQADSIAIPETSPKFSGNNKGARIFALIVTAQLGLLLAFGVPYAQTLAFGKTIVLKCHTYDPRDMLKGDYAAITYDVGSKVHLEKFKAGETAYLTLKKQATYWEPVAASQSMPKSLNKDEAAMKIIVNGTLGDRQITTGIEKYYVPEGAARELSSNGLTAEVALSDDGMPVFKRLLSNGADVKTLISK